MTSKKVQFTPRKAFISVVSLVLVLALLITAMCITSKDGGLKVKAASGVLTSVSGNNIIPDEYEGVNVPAGTYLMSEEEYAKGASATPHKSEDGVSAFDFHVFAVNFAAGIHTCGNIAVEHLGGEVLGNTSVPEFGSRTEHETLTEKLSYVGDTVSWSQATQINSMTLVLGDGNTVTGEGQIFLNSNGNSMMLGNGKAMLDNIYIDDGTPFINITEELDEAEDYQRYLVWLQEQIQKNSTYVQGWGYATTVNGETARVLTYNDLYTYGWGSITLDFSKYTEETIIVDFDTYYSSGSWWSWPGWYSNANALIAGQVKIKGTAGKRVIFNVDTSNLYNDSISFYNITMTVDSISNSEGSVEKDNNVLWNFYQKNSSDGVARSTTGQIDISGTWVGTVLAPDATINANAGLNGSMIAEKVTSGCETHKSDYTGEKINQTEDDGTTSLTVTKIWDDNPDTRPNHVSIKLLQNGTVYQTVQISESTAGVTVSSDGNTWTYEFTDLPLTDVSGNYYRYTIDEVVPAGYTKTIFNNTIINTSEGGAVETPEYGSITVNKTAKGSSALLGGAWFKLTSNSGANLSGAIVVDGNADSFNATDNEITWCSVEGANVVIGNLPVGDYTLYETSAPAGYVTAASTAVKVEKDTNSEYTVENEQIKVKFAKLDENGDMLTGATLQITSAYGADLSKLTVTGATVLEQTSSIIKVKTTGTEFSLAGITEGYYTLTELEAPEGYQIAAPITFYVNGSGAIYDSNWQWLSRVDMTDALAPEEEPEAVTHTISINKTDGVNALSGAVLELASATGADLAGVTINGATNESADTKVIRWTSNGSAVTFENLPEGYYTLTEVTAPAGYKKTAQMTLDVKEGSTEFTMTDSVITMSVSKRDKNSGVEINGAALKLTASGIDLSDVTAENADNFSASSSAITWTSTGTPAVFEKLPAGNYTLSEVTAPAGYKTAADINFTIDEYGNITGSSISGGECVMYDEPVTLDIAKLYWNDKDGDSKVDDGEKGTLAGAKLKLTADADLTNVTGTISVTHEADGSLTWTSGTRANTLRGLPDGNYTLTELSAPDGYDPASAITFTVSGGKISSCTTANEGDEYNESAVKMCDKRTVFYQVQISKVDAADNNELLEGATIGIFPEGTTSFIADNAVVVYESTNAPNELILSNGNYILRELKAPEGYDLNTECICFTVYNGDVTITDVYTPAGEIIIGKMEDTYENCNFFNGSDFVHVNITEFVEANGHMPPESVAIKIPTSTCPDYIRFVTAMAYLDSENQGVAGTWNELADYYISAHTYSSLEEALAAGNEIFYVSNENGYDYYGFNGLQTPNVGAEDIELDRSVYSVAEIIFEVHSGITDNNDTGDDVKHHSTEELWSELGAEISIFYGDTEIILGDKIVKGDESGESTSASSSALFTNATIPVEYWNWFVGYHVDITEQVAQYGWPTELIVTPNSEEVFNLISYDVIYSADKVEGKSIRTDSNSIADDDATKNNGVWTYPIESDAVSDYVAEDYGSVYLIVYPGDSGIDLDTFNGCNPIIKFGDVAYSGDTGSGSEGSGSESTDSSGITKDSVIVEKPTDSKPVVIKLPNSETPQADRYLYAVQLAKKDGSGNAITGNPAQFVLYDSNGNLVRLEGSDGVYKYNYEKESDLVFESANFTDKSQTKSSITLTETPAAINYNLPGGVVEGSTIEIVIANSDGKSLTIPAVTLTSTNGSLKNVDFSSLDYQTGETLTVTVNETYPDGSSAFTVELDFVYPLYTSSAAGTINVTGLWLGDYRFVETEAPANYKNENGTVGFTLTEWNTEGNPAKLTVKNILEQGSVLFTKTDDNGNPKEGAEFDLYRLSPSEINSTDPTGTYVGTYTTDHTGKVTASGLDLGYLYYAIEKTAPAGTENSNANVKLPQLESTGINASRYVINNNIISFGIYLGEYSDSVKAQVLNYDLSGSESATVEWVDVDTVVTDGSMSVVNNAYRTTFLKTDGTNPLAGATFKLVLKNAGEKAQLNLVSANVITTETVEATDKDGNVLTKNETVYTPVALTHVHNCYKDDDGNITYAEEYLMWTSTDDAEGITLLGLPNLEYTLEEVSAPAGYEKDSEVKTVTVGTGFDNVVDYTVVNDKLYGSITLVKSDSVTGARMENVEFVLETSTDGGTTWSAYNTYKTDANGTITADNLPYGASYRFKETVPVGYTTENVYTDVITIEGETSAEMIHKVYVSNTPETTSVSGTKTWDDDDNNDRIRPESITVNLLANGEEVDEVAVTADDNWTYEFTDLPKYKDGQLIEYKVTEDAVTGYTASIDGYNITNTHDIETLSISGTKTWNDADNQDGIRPSSVTVNLLADGTEIKETVVKADANGNWTYEFTDLAKYNDGKVIVYTVTEDAVENYTTEINGYNIINSYTPGKTSVTVTKVWNDTDDQDGIRPEKVTVNLLANGTKVATKELTEQGNWTCTFNDLALKSNGAAIEYTVEELSVEGYTVEVTGNATSGYTITNTHTTAVTSISGTKTWVDDNDRDGLRPDAISVRLYADGDEVETATVTADSNWAYEFTNLPKYRDGGTEIEYTVTEDTVDGYTTTQNGFDFTNTHAIAVTSVSGTKTWVDDNDRDGLRPDAITVRLYADGTELNSTEVTADANGNWKYEFTNLPKYRDGGTEIKYTVTEDAVAGYETAVSGYNITNTHATETTSVSGTKTWSDNNDQDGIRPTSITVNLLADEEKVDSKAVTADNNWAYEFTNLPKYRDGGIEIEYTVTEDAVAGYETAVSGYNITNTHTPETTSVSGTKTWVDADNQDGKRPTSITIRLFADGEEVKTATVTADSNWSYEFTNLPKYRNGGTVIVYTVTEDAVANYITEINGYNITNTHTPEKISVSGTKTWVDADNQDGKRPASITVNLYADGEKVSSKTVTEADNWTYEFENLDKYKEGKEITYTITEDTVEDYTTVINGYDITNSYTPGVVSVKVEKKWDDANNQDGKRPTSITVNLLADGAVKETATIMASSGWSHTFSSLPEYADGKEIVYTVTEEAVAGYTTKIDGYTITNSHTPEKTSVSGTKTWVDANNQDGKRPASITVNLLANGTKVDSKTVTAADGWTYTFTNLDKYSAGKEIVYTVSEETVEGYTATVDGYDITNTYTPEVMSVSGTKDWVDNNDNDGLRPDSITVNLLADGTKVDSKTVTAADGWAYTFDNLPKYKAGEAITYTVTEDEVEYYTTSIDGYNITNTHTPLTGSITLTAKKTLEGKTLGNEKFSFTLKDSDGNVIETVNNNGADITFTALNYTYNDIGTHTYTITEDSYNSKGIKNDKTVHTVIVTVAHNGGDSLTVTADKNGDAIEFVNVYTAAPVTVQIEGTKTLSGKKLAVNDFSFTLTGEGKSETVKNAADGSIAFSEITFDAKGTYEYTIIEVDEGKGGVTYDESIYTWTVVVTDNGEGKLVAEETLKKDGKSATELVFANSYATGSTTCTISGVKELIGRNLAAGEFEFTLSEDGKVLRTASNAADGSFTFETIEYTAAGEHTYTVKEVVPTDTKGVKYDTKEYTVTVTVTDNGDGTLTATPSINGEQLAFKNSYTAAPAKVTFNGTKTFNKTLEGEEFSFVLKDADGKVIETVKNAADGSFEFAELTLSETKTYTYTISEVIPTDKKGITYDESVYTWTVKVTDNGEGQLVTEKTLTKDGKAASAVEFTNSYAAASTTYTISGTKTLTGKTLEAGMFSFTISDAEGVIATASNTENGTFTFEPINYTEAGTYEYTVEEVVPEGDKKGITYDGRKYTVEVSVVDNGNGSLVATGPENLSSELKFENSYTAQPAKVSVNGVKTLNGRDITEGEFEFTLSDAENNVLQTVKNSASGTFVFEDITLNAVGEYTYSIKEVVGSAEDISYDATEYVMTVKVTDNGEGELEAVRTIVKKGEEGEAGVRFVNDVIGAYITISKRAMTGSDELPGAKLTLTPDGDIDLSKVELPEGVELKDGSIAWTSSDKSVVLGVVPNGIYEFKEVTAPDGYDVAEIIYVKIDGSSVYAVPASEYKEDGTTEWGSAVSENTVIMKDAPNKLVLSKKELADGPELPGAKLVLKPVDSDIDLSDVEIPENVSCTDNVITWTSGEEETEIGRVPDGIYEFTEITAPDGYEVAETIYVKVSASDIYYASSADSEKWTAVGESDTVVMLDAPTKLVISKLDAVKSEELPGAVLTIEPVGDIDLSGVRAPEEVVVTDSKITWTSTDEKTEIERLPQGIYTLTETTAPSGYERDEVAYIKVSGSDIYSVKMADYKGDSTEWTKEDDETVVMEDAYNTLVLSKVEFGGGAELPNAMLTLEATSSDTDLTVVVTSRSDIAKSKKSISWVSADKALDLHFVPDGIYKFTEQIAPAGYEMAEFIYVKVENGNVYYAPSITESEWKLVGNDTVVMEDKPTELVISKKAVGGGSELPGAVLKIESADGTADLSKVRIPEGVTYKDNTITWTSGNEAVEFERIPNGVYKFTEVTAPEGYEIAEVIYVKVSDSDIYAVKASEYSGETTEWGEAVDNDTVVMYDAPVVIPKTANISFVKYSNINTKLNGAVFTLTSADGTKKTATSGTDGVVMFTAVPEGTYSLAETTAPDNYSKSTNIITIIVDSNGAVSYTGPSGNAIDIMGVEQLMKNNVIPVEDNKDVTVGDTVDLKDQLIKENPGLKDETVIWQSSDDSIASVDQNGKVTVKKPGKVTINAYKNGTVVGTFVLGASEEYVPPTNNSPNTGDTDTPTTGDDNKDIIAWNIAIASLVVALATAKAISVRRKKRTNS